jgi:beta-phosphoglucomutase-like phosphatase (HAD superfamily)
MTAPAPSRLHGVFFDVDGVLLDSLQHHLRFCADKAAEYGLRLRMPSPSRFRSEVARGLDVSPMEQFFRAVGFPADLADRGAREYRIEFPVRYRPRPFPGIPKTLARLAAAGFTLGLVSSNTRENVEAGLGASMACFDPRCRFFFDPVQGIDKAACLRRGAELLGVPASACVYVGDQRADVQAARRAGCRFLGVTYGWGIVGPQDDFETVDRADAIADVLTQAQPPADDPVALARG